MTQNELQEITVQKCLDFFKTQKRGLLNYAMRSGKSGITLKFLQKFFEFDAKILICYPNNSILNNWMQECHKWGYVNPNVIYTNFSSLKKYTDEIYDFIIVDECHDVSALELATCHYIMTNSGGTRILLLSGTISKETEQMWGIPTIATYSTLDGIKDQILADYSITVHLVELDTIVKTPNKKGKMLTEKQKYDNYSFVIQKMKEDGKNAMHLALSRNRLSSSSLGKMNYLKKLLKQLVDKRVIVFTGLTEVADNIGIPSYHSKSTSNVNFIQFQGGLINQLALVEAGKLGVSYKNLDSVVLLNTTYNSENTSQAINRAIQLDYPSKVADIHLIGLNEKPEIKKIKESLSMLDKNKIVWKK